MKPTTFPNLLAFISLLSFNSFEDETVVGGQAVSDVSYTFNSFEDETRKIVFEYDVTKRALSIPLRMKLAISFDWYKLGGFMLSIPLRMKHHVLTVYIDGDLIFQFL